MQQPGPLFRAMPSLPSVNITTEQVQKYLDENKKLILAIMDSQNVGNLVECAQYQLQLQKNLMYLAALADAQPQGPSAMTPQHMQMSPHLVMQQQQGGYFMQHPQAPAAMATQQAGLHPQSPAAFNHPHPMQDPQQQYLPQQLNPQMTQGQIVGAPNGMFFPQNDTKSVVGSCSVPISTKEEKPDVTSPAPAPLAFDARGNPRGVLDDTESE